MRFGLKFILAKKRTKSLKLLFTAKQNSFDPCFVAALVLFNCSSGSSGEGTRGAADFALLVGLLFILFVSLVETFFGLFLCRRI